MIINIGVIHLKTRGCTLVTVDVLYNQNIRVHRYSYYIWYDPPQVIHN